MGRWNGRSKESIVWAMIDAEDCETLTSRRLSLAAIDSAVTVELTLDNHPVSERSVTSVESFSEWAEKYRHGLRSNGSNPLGVTSRATRLLGPSPLDEQLNEARNKINKHQNTQTKQNTQKNTHKIAKPKPHQLQNTTAEGYCAYYSLIV